MPLTVTITDGVLEQGQERVARARRCEAMPEAHGLAAKRLAATGVMRRSIARNVKRSLEFPNQEQHCAQAICSGRLSAVVEKGSRLIMHEGCCAAALRMARRHCF